MGTEGAFPPFNYVDTDGTIKGFDVEIGNALCAKMNRSCEWIAQEWQGIIPALQGGKFDVIMSSMAITPERSQQVAFTKPYYFTKAMMVGRAADKLSQAPESLSGKTVGAVRDTVNAKYIESKYGSVANVQVYASSNDLFLDLTNGRLDAVFADAVELMPWLQKNGGTTYAPIGETISGPEFGEGIGIAVRTEDKELLADLNKALDAIFADGTYATINQKYFDFSLR